MQAYLAIKYRADLANRMVIEQLLSVLEAHGIATTCCVRDIEQWGTRYYSAAELMRLTFAAIDQCDVVIVELTEKGVGLGIEAGYAYASNKQSAILILEKCQ